MKLLNLLFIGLIFIGITSSILLIHNYIMENKQVVVLPSTYNLGDAGNPRFEYNIEQASIENNMLTIKGWGLIKGNKKPCKINLLIKDSNGKLYKLKYTKEERKDVTKFFNDGFNYDDSGFLSAIDINNIDMKVKYLVVVQIEIGKERFYTIDRKVIN